jgi:hypothetical protein
MYSVSLNDDSVDERKDSGDDDHRDVGGHTSCEDGADNVHRGDQAGTLVAHLHLQQCYSFYPQLMRTLPRASRPRRQGPRDNSDLLSSSF